MQRLPECKMPPNRFVTVRISSHHPLHILSGKTPTFIPPKHISTAMAKARQVEKIRHGKFSLGSYSNGGFTCRGARVRSSQVVETILGTGVSRENGYADGSAIGSGFRRLHVDILLWGLGKREVRGERKDGRPVQNIVFRGSGGCRWRGMLMLMLRLRLRLRLRRRGLSAGSCGCRFRLLVNRFRPGMVFTRRSRCRAPISFLGVIVVATREPVPIQPFRRPLSHRPSLPIPQS